MMAKRFIEISATKIQALQDQIANLQPVLDKLSDVTLTNPQDGDLLVYDSGSGKWVNGGGIIALDGPF